MPARPSVEGDTFARPTPKAWATIAPRCEKEFPTIEQVKHVKSQVRAAAFHATMQPACRQTGESTWIRRDSSR